MQRRRSDTGASSTSTSASPRRTRRAARSPRPGSRWTNSPRQYHWSPAGYTASNAEFHAGSGTGATPSRSGLPNDARLLRARRSPPRRPGTRRRAQTLRRCSSSGNGGPGGTERNAKKPLELVRLRRHELAVPPSTSAASSRCRSPALRARCSTGWQRNENDVTTPKLPPPPRIAQKRSGSLLGVGRDDRAVREDDGRRDEVVDRQPARARQMSDAAAEREAADAGRRDDARGHCAPVLVRRRVDLPEAARRPARAPCAPRGRP